MGANQLYLPPLKESHMRAIWLTTTATLFIISCFFSIRLLLQLADGTVTGAAYSAVAVALALTQYASLPQGLNLWGQKRRFTGGLYITTWAMLTALSIAASAGSLIGDTQHQQKQNLTGSTEYQLLLGQIKQLQLQATGLQQSAALDTENGYRSRAIKTLDRLPGIQQNISALRQQLSELPANSNTAATALFERIALQLGASTDNVMTAAYLIVAILIELALTASVAALADTEQQTENNPAKTKSSKLTTSHPLSEWLNKTLQQSPGGRPVTS